MTERIAKDISNSDLAKTFLAHGPEAIAFSALIHLKKHIFCLAEGNAILADVDGLWCSKCEREQFDIGVEEQNE